MNHAANTPPKPPLAPRHWPFWLGVGVAWLCSHLPYRALVATGRALGTLAYRTARRRRHIAEVNLRLCFPEKSEEERRLLLRRHFQELGTMMMEAPLGWTASLARLRTLTQVDGMEHLRAALAHGKGVILLGAHFTGIELSGPLLATANEHPVDGVYRPHENPVLEYLIRRGRQRYFVRLIARDDVRGMLRSLKQNHILWFAPDQAYRGRGSIPAPFFGVPAPTNTATARLAKMSGAAVVPFFPARGPDGYYRLTLLPALENFPTGGGDLADATRIHHLFEERIRLAPEQYFWIHRRFKARRGERDPYRE